MSNPSSSQPSIFHPSHAHPLPPPLPLQFLTVPTHSFYPPRSNSKIQLGKLQIKRCVVASRRVIRVNIQEERQTDRCVVSALIVQGLYWLNLLESAHRKSCQMLHITSPHAACVGSNKAWSLFLVSALSQSNNYHCFYRSIRRHNRSLQRVVMRWSITLQHALRWSVHTRIAICRFLFKTVTLLRQESVSVTWCGRFYYLRWILTKIRTKCECKQGKKDHLSVKLLKENSHDASTKRHGVIFVGRHRLYPARKSFIVSKSFYGDFSSERIDFWIVEQCLNQWVAVWRLAQKKIMFRPVIDSTISELMCDNGLR